MKLTLRLTLTFTATLALVLALSLSFVFLQSTANVTKAITSKALVLIKTFEAQMDAGVGQEDEKGRNELFERVVTNIQQKMPEVTEINVYHVGLAKVVASNDEASVGKEVDPEDLEAAQTDKGVILYPIEDGKPIIDVTEPLHSGGRIDYVIGVKTNIDDDMAEVRALVVLSLTLGVGGALLGGLLIVLTARRIVRPLVRTGELFQAMAQGDLTGRAQAGGRDEVGSLALSYNAYTDQLSAEIRKLQEVSGRSRSLGSSLADNARRVDDGVGSIRLTLGELQQRLQTLNEGVNSPDFSLGDVQTFLRTLLTDLEDQSQSVNQSKETTHEMVEALQLISSETTDKLALAGQMTELGRRGDAQMQTTVASIQQVAKLTQGISEFIRVIHDVADQTNLLAMNASIEAAHAGAAGRGFAVVAGEIRKLSEATSSNAKNIAASLDQMVGAVKKAETDVAGTGTTIHQLTQGVEHLSIAMMTVNAALQALSEETGTVTRAFDHLREITDGVLDRSATIGRRIERMEGAMTDLVAVANQNAVGFRSITEKLDDLGAESGRLGALIDDNAENVEVLEAVTGAFRVGA